MEEAASRQSVMKRPQLSAGAALERVWANRRPSWRARMGAFANEGRMKITVGFRSRQRPDSALHVKLGRENAEWCERVAIIANARAIDHVLDVFRPSMRLGRLNASRPQKRTVFYRTELVNFSPEGGVRCGRPASRQRSPFAKTCAASECRAAPAPPSSPR